MPAHPPIDPEIAAAMLAVDGPPTSLRPEDIAVRRAAEIRDREALTCGGAIDVRDVVLAGPADNPQIDALVLTPTGARSDAAAATESGSGAELPSADSRLGDGGSPARPAIVYIHGGGTVFGHRFDVEPMFLDAALSGCVVISVDYRLAPEHPYPAAVEDCYAAWGAVVERAAEFGIDQERIAIGGASAGGGLAAATALLLRDRGGVPPSHQLLLFPMLDDRQITPSSRELVAAGRWDSVSNNTGWRAYLGDRCGTDNVPPYAAPARADDLSRLPRTYIELGDVETFRDENLDYAARLSRAGVPVELHVWPGGVHSFVKLAPTAALSRAAADVRHSYLEREIL